ncbi:ABC transporter permease [Leptospira santarosai]|uniref:Transport permease protein n=6 Tax=Leptospira santarosai TaxID=28183 RepID=A0A2P1QSE5_9LEPT|nr:ABC transporter permease [Leptospira santarosai]EMO56684.1 ABC-2 type transporter [Leptospira santarosai str. CBC1416]ASV11611.1 ABC transporter permease [Leptospira santarosai]AVQ11835.1 Transport permease protein [Leptospira santarosai]AVV80237.1 Transport permease protein [Leptospira santarosai]EKO31987.1 ABC-2 type transporter [Leptospira santarosai str. MOR084]
MNLIEKYNTFKTIVIKETIRILRIWVQTIIPPGITITLYFIIFGKLIGSQIGNIGDHTYIQFIVPGLVMMSVIINSYNNVVSSFFGAKFQKNIEEILVSPTPPYLIVLGFTIGGVIRGMSVGILVIAISLFFTELEVRYVSMLIATVFLSSLLFSLGGLLNALYAKKFDDVTIIPTFILTPLTYLGGVFYSIQMLPPFWQNVSKLNPILYMVNAFRYGFLGVSDIEPWFALSMIGAATLSLYALSVYLLKKGIGIRN